MKTFREELSVRRSLLSRRCLLSRVKPAPGQWRSDYERAITRNRASRGGGGRGEARGRGRLCFPGALFRIFSAAPKWTEEIVYETPK